MRAHRRGCSFLRFCIAVLRDERGQDLIEYALLTAFIGLAGAVAWVNIRSSLGTTYTSYDTSVQDAWQQPAPTGGGS